MFISFFQKCMHAGGREVGVVMYYTQYTRLVLRNIFN